MARAGLLTIGYERRDLDELLALLHTHGVEVLVDVRATPRSRKPGLSKRRLAQALDEAGIEYRLERALGVPADRREAFRAGDPATLERYRRELDEDADGAVARVTRLARARRVALLCFERNEEACHRRVVAAAVRERAPAVAHTAIE